jgi:hypothetical protein
MRLFLPGRVARSWVRVLPSSQNTGKKSLISSTVKDGQHE